MKLLADANLEPALVAALREDGHNVSYVREIRKTAKDDLILKLAHKQRRVVVTNDLDFGDLTVRDQMAHAGVILLRLAPLTLAARIARTREFLRSVSEIAPGVLYVVEPARERKRSTAEEKSE